MRSPLAAAALVSGALLFGGVGIATAATTDVTVSSVSTSGNGWFKHSTTAPGIGSFATGPLAPPVGFGSYKLDTSSSLTSARVQLLTNLYNGTRLADIDGLGYSSYRETSPPGSVGAAALNMRVNLTGGTLPTHYFVYELYWNHGNASILNGVWQNWTPTATVPLAGGATRSPRARASAARTIRAPGPSFWNSTRTPRSATHR